MVQSNNNSLFVPLIKALTKKLKLKKLIWQYIIGEFYSIVIEDLPLGYVNEYCDLRLQ